MHKTQHSTLNYQTLTLSFFVSRCFVCAFCAFLAPVRDALSSNAVQLLNDWSRGMIYDYDKLLPYFIPHFALVVTLTMLLRHKNCRFIITRIIITYLFAQSLI